MRRVWRRVRRRVMRRVWRRDRRRAMRRVWRRGRRVRATLQDDVVDIDAFVAISPDDEICGSRGSERMLDVRPSIWRTTVLRPRRATIGADLQIVRVIVTVPMARVTLKLQFVSDAG